LARIDNPVRAFLLYTRLALSSPPLGQVVLRPVLSRFFREDSKSIQTNTSAVPMIAGTGFFLLVTLQH